jgi:hypothetical protein
MGGSLAKGGDVGDPGAGTTPKKPSQHKTQLADAERRDAQADGRDGRLLRGVQFIPGYTFGWAPKELAAIAYVNSVGRPRVMDKDRNKQEVDSTKACMLPAGRSTERRSRSCRRRARTSTMYGPVTWRP